MEGHYAKISIKIFWKPTIVQFHTPLKPELWNCGSVNSKCINLVEQLTRISRFVQCMMQMTKLYPLPPPGISHPFGGCPYSTLHSNADSKAESKLSYDAKKLEGLSVEDLFRELH